ncbi:MAG: hypothetical protein OEL57_14490, partial [Trichlorobacter sp.]|uniref:hypothetical protein n=1 Tax=Trichlorobacter sp. TaxID=2911007 RepID=UPI00256C98F7
SAACYLTAGLTGYRAFAVVTHAIYSFRCYSWLYVDKDGTGTEQFHFQCFINFINVNNNINKTN